MTHPTQLKKLQIIEQYLDCKHILATIQSPVFSKYGIAPKSIHRAFSNGKRRINGITNREFYSANFIGGYYNFIQNGVYGIFEYRLLPIESPSEILLNEVRQRLEDLIWVDCDVRLSPTALPIENLTYMIDKIRLTGELYLSKISHKSLEKNKSNVELHEITSNY